MMFETLEIKRFSFGTVYKILAIASGFSMVPASILMGLFAFFGAETIVWNGRHLTGLMGLIASPFVGIMLAAIFTGFLGTLFACGLWLYSKLRPLSIEFEK
jgi:phosphate/sulfate permease